MAVPMRAEGASICGVQGYGTPENILRYVPPRCHFLHFENTVNGNTAPKIFAASWSDAKRVKMAKKTTEKRQRGTLKDWRILTKKGRPEVFAENGRVSGQNGRVGISAFVPVV